MEFKLLVLIIAMAVSAQVANCENEDTTTDIKAFAADGKQLIACQAIFLNLRYALTTAKCANETDFITVNNGNKCENLNFGTRPQGISFSLLQ
jgi:secreted trypsin-like serine protease